MKANLRGSFIIPEISVLIINLLSISIVVSAATVAIGPGPFRTVPSADVNIKWPNNTVPFEIDEELSSVKESIIRAMQMIQGVSCIRFVERTTEIDYVRFHYNTTRCFEPVGRLGGAQSIYVNIPECGYLGFFIHASMHGLGFSHEQQRADRDNYINVYWENIKPERFDLFKKWNETTYFHTAVYDVDSIMHLGSYQVSKNGKPTTLTKTGGTILHIKERPKLSKLDILGINTYYNCPGHDQD